MPVVAAPRACEVEVWKAGVFVVVVGVMLASD